VYINELPDCLNCLEFIGQLDNCDFEGKYLPHAGGYTRMSRGNISTIIL
jgi:hypothetical protein